MRTAPSRSPVCIEMLACISNWEGLRGEDCDDNIKWRPKGHGSSLKVGLAALESPEMMVKKSSTSHNPETLICSLTTPAPSKRRHRRDRTGSACDTTRTGRTEDRIR